MLLSRTDLLTSIYFVVLLSVHNYGWSQSNISSQKPYTIVIDPGHGGHDTGARGTNSHEKDVALTVALQLGRIISNHKENYNVVFTRTEDIFIPLNERIQMANNINADLFVSIHCNSVAGTRQASGTETFVMGLHSSEENLNVAKRENASILLEQDYESNYEGFDPYSIEGHILLSALQNSHLNQSIDAAQLIQDQIGQNTPLKDRGVKQAGFVLLRQATMPSILLETAFISNNKDQAYLLSERGRNQICNAVADGIIKYAQKSQSENIVVESNLIAVSNTSITNEKSSINNRPPSPYAIAPPAKKIISEPKSDSTVYSVQIASTKNPMDMKNHEKFKTLAEIVEKKEGELYKYVVGQYTNLVDAVDARQKLRDNGFKGAFVVAYQDNKRIKL